LALERRPGNRVATRSPAYHEDLADTPPRSLKTGHERWRSSWLAAFEG
jgi:hypothetical protein